MPYDPPINDEDTINILRFVERTNPIVNFRTPRKEKLKNNFDTLLNYLVSLSHLEEAELNLYNIPHVQKSLLSKA